MPIKNKVKSIPGLFVAIACSTALCAASGFEHNLVPLELVEYLNGGAVYSSLPDGFPLVPLPAGIGLSVIGSVDQGYTQQVLLRGTRGSAEVRADLLAAYTGAGWTDLSREPGFSQLCHDQFGSLQISFVDASNGENRVQVSRNRVTRSLNPGYPACAQQLEHMLDTNESAASFTAFLALMPLLEVPENSTTPPVLFMPYVRSSSTPGYGAELSSDGTIGVFDMTMAELHEHFAAQMERQGWQADSEDAGSFSASSVWYKTAQLATGENGVSEDIPLTGIMTILNTEDASFRVLFKMQSDAIASYSFGPPVNDPRLGIRGIPPSPERGIHGMPPYIIPASAVFQ